MPDLTFEIKWRKKGFRAVAGIDEAGRGPLAGPVVAAAVVLPERFKHAKLNDSKQLSEKQRESIYAELTEGGAALAWAFAVVDVAEIDSLNILRASHLAMEKAVKALSISADAALIDGSPLPKFCLPYEAVVKGDGRSLSIAAASVIAKVERDRLMCDYSRQYPHYGFEAHKGYGTRQHLEALRNHGPCPIHRRSFRPVSQLAFDLG